MKKSKKDDSGKNLDTLFERLTKKAIAWETEKETPNENIPSDKELRDKQDPGGDEKDSRCSTSLSKFPARWLW